jgi:hypothetical protein
MSKPIAVGDLVMIVRGCLPELYGTVFQVSKLHYRDIDKCPSCEARHRELFAISTTPYGEIEYFGKCYAAPLSWLQRIPPPEELSTIKELDDLTV